MDDIRQQLYSETRKDLLNRQLSNAQNVDRAILSLSTAGLVFSLALIKYILPISINSIWVWALYLSWMFFVLAIFSTLTSFITSQIGLKKQLVYAKKYYIDEENEYLYKRNLLACITDFLYYVSVIIFFFAVILIIVFIYKNLPGGS